MRSDEEANAGPIGSVDRLVFATRVGGLPHLITALRGVLGAEVGLFDLGGSVIATSPARAIWDPDAVRAASADEGAGLVVRAVELESEVVAHLAVRLEADPGTVLDLTVDLIMLELSRLQAGQQGRRELAESLIDDVLSGRLSEPDAVGRLRAVGVDATRPFRVLLGWADEPAEGVLRVPLGGIYALMSDRPDPFLRVPLDGHVLMVVPDDPMVDRIARGLCTQLEDGATPIGARVGVGVSLPHTGGGGLRAAYYEAMSASRVGPGVRYPGRIDLGKLLVLANTTMPLPDIARDQLRPLLDYDEQHGSNLAETLQTYLAVDRDIIATTQELFIHRNTLRYRLRQITELLGADIESTAVITSLWLAFVALDQGDTTANEGFR